MSEQEREGLQGEETDWPSIKPDLQGGAAESEQDPDDPGQPPRSD